MEAARLPRPYDEKHGHEDQRHTQHRQGHQGRAQSPPHRRMMRLGGQSQGAPARAARAGTVAGDAGAISLCLISDGHGTLLLR